ncbi:hypothetical protein MY11210_000376 [Beauveria gryllotalpidicola]
MASTQVTEGSAARISQAVATIAPQFIDDPVLVYITNNYSKDQRLPLLNTVFEFMISAAVANKGTIYEAADWKSATVIVPPGKDVANPMTLISSGGLGVFANLGISGTIRSLYEFPRQIGPHKTRVLGKRPFYYVFIVATVPEGRGRGLASKIIKQVLAIAQKEQKPAWLEASTESSKRVYAKLGFKEVGTVVLGKGKCDAKGLPMKGGPGVRLWPMVWEPLEESQHE